MQIMASPGGRLIYGIFHISSNRPNFVAVTLDQNDSRIYRLCKRPSHQREHVWYFSCRDCNMSISEVDSSVKHSECNSNQVQEAIRSIRQWAAFRAIKEAKAAGRETFTIEEWQRWKAVAEHSLENPSDEEFSQVKKFVEVLNALPTDRMEDLTMRAEAGEALVRSTNQFPPWRSSSRGRKRGAPPTFDEDHSALIEVRRAASPKTVSSLQMVIPDSSGKLFSSRFMTVLSLRIVFAGAGSEAAETMATRFTRVLERVPITSESNGTGLVQDPHLEEVSESVIDPAPEQSPVETQHNSGSSYR